MTEQQALEHLKRARAEVRALQRIVWILAHRLGGIRITVAELVEAPPDPEQQLVVYRDIDGSNHIDTRC
jgi:hypothetical protein